MRQTIGDLINHSREQTANSPRTTSRESRRLGVPYLDTEGQGATNGLAPYDFLSSAPQKGTEARWPHHCLRRR